MAPTFQTLPENIIGLIYDTIIHDHRSRWPWEVDDTNGVSGSYFPLLSTCQSWRELGVQRIYGDLMVAVCTHADLVNVCYSDMPNTTIEPTHPYLRYVRVVNLSINFGAVISGRILAILEQSTYARLVLPQAHTLMLTFSNHRDEEFSVPSKPLPFMQVLAAKIKSIVPMAKDITARCYLDNFKADKTCAELIGRFVRLLYSTPRKFRAVNFNTPKSSLLVPNFTSGITEFETDWNEHCELKARITHLNALTLQCLTIKFRHTKDIHTLINSHGDYIVVYPNMRILDFSSYTLSHQSVKPELSKDAVPFPKLQYLSLDMDYPFADDVLFRGNSDTLEYLRIQPGIEVIYMMDRYGVFGSAKYRRLTNVKISERLVSDASKSIVAQFVLRLSSHAQVLDIQDATLGNEFVISVVRQKSLGHLQRLNVYNFMLTLCEIINLLASLPSLTQLTSREPELGHQFDEMDIEPDDLGDYMLMSYYPLSMHFKKWICYSSSTSSAEVMSLCAVLLAIACPKLSCASITPTNYNKYCECVSEIISEEPYASFIELIEPLPIPIGL